MKIKKYKLFRAKEMGFCQGVKEAVELAKITSENNKNSNIYMLGMIVHNQQVIDDLDKMGIKVLNEEDVLEGTVKFEKDDIVIVRAHGTIKKIYEILKNSNIVVYDAACVFVKRIRKIIKDKKEEGYDIIFIGDKNHPEVRGIISHGENIEVFSDLEDLKNSKIDKNGKYYFMAQTTLNKNVYNEIKSYIKKYFLNSSVGDTICGATYVRQKAVEELSKKVEVVLIVGGKKSSNTKKLYEISKKNNKNSYLIENSEELDMNWLKGVEVIGITAGASTPEKSIIEIERIIKGEVS